LADDVHGAQHRAAQGLGLGDQIEHDEAVPAAHVFQIPQSRGRALRLHPGGQKQRLRGLACLVDRHHEPGLSLAIRLSKRRYDDDA
jgi:hypothetical protein